MEGSVRQVLEPGAMHRKPTRPRHQVSRLRPRIWCARGGCRHAFLQRNVPPGSLARGEPVAAFGTGNSAAGAINFQPLLGLQTVLNFSSTSDRFLELRTLFHRKFQAVRRHNHRGCVFGKV